MKSALDIGACGLALAAACLVHLATLLSNLPASPLVNALLVAPVLETANGFGFRHSWSMFAPIPESSSLDIDFRCAEHRLGWRSATEPHREKKNHGNPLGDAFAGWGWMDIARDLAVHFERGVTKDCSPLPASERDACKQRVAKQIERRPTYALALLDAQRRCAEVHSRVAQIRLTRTHPLPYAKRHLIGKRSGLRAHLTFGQVSEEALERLLQSPSIE